MKISRTIKFLISLCLAICLVEPSYGQILTFDFAGIAGNEASINSNFNNANLNSSTINRGGGISASANADRFSSDGWTTANSVDAADYVSFTITPNAGYQFSVSSIYMQHQRSGTGPVRFVVRNSLDGYTSDLGGVHTIADVTTTQNYTFTFAQGNQSGAVTYRIYGYSAEGGTGTWGPGDGAGNDIIVNGTVSSSSNTITTGTVSSPPFAVTCTATASGTVAFTSTGTFSGNTYTAQLSDGTGSFASPINIGTLVSNANSGTINITIPVNTPGDNGYRIRVISSNPPVTGTQSASFRINMSGDPCTYFEIESILVNSCGGAVEGENEMFRFEVGAVPINTADIVVTWPNNPWLGICQNATTANIVNQINNDCTPPGEVLEPPGGIIPAGATVLFFTSTTFDENLFDWSTLNYTIYAIFQCPGNTNGHFANTDTPPCEGRTLTMTVTGYSSDEVTYDPCVMVNTDGEAVDFNADGDPTYGNTGGCVAPFFPLPVEMLNFTGSCINGSSVLQWTTATETNNDRYYVLRSDDGEEYTVIGSVSGAGNSNSSLQYQYIDGTALSGISYYSLKQTDFVGRTTLFGPISVLCTESADALQLLSYGEADALMQLFIHCPTDEPVACELYDLTGRRLFYQIIEGTAGERQLIIPAHHVHGICLFRLSNGTGSVNTKLYIE